MSHAQIRPRATRCPTSASVGGPLDVLAVRIDATQATVQFVGELDIANADLAAGALADELGQGRRHVRLDLSGLTFSDCSGVHVLVDAHNRFLSAGGTLVLTGVGPRVARLLALAHLDESLFIAAGSGEPRRARHLTSVPRDGT